MTKRSFQLVKTEHGFVPAHDSDAEITNKIKVGDSIEGRAGFPRNLEFHKKFFALIRFTYHHMSDRLVEAFPSEDALRLELTLQAGYWDKHITLGGKEVIYPRSISFDGMDQIEFEKFYNAVLDVVTRWFVKEIDQDELLNFM